MEHNIKEDINANIKAGIYKLAMNKSDDRDVWKTFAMILKADESVVNGYYYCIYCTTIFKSAGSSQHNLYRHISRCPIKLKSKAEVEPSKTVEHNGCASLDIKMEIRSNLNAGVYTLAMNKRKLWEKYAMVSKEDGSIVNGYHCCVNCRKLFKTTSNYFSLRRHMKECTEDKTIAYVNEVDHGNPGRSEEFEIKTEIKTKLNSGIYKLTLKSSVYGKLWKNMAVITKAEDGSLVTGYCCCIHCSAVLKINPKHANSLHHIRSCAKKLSSNNNVEMENINTNDEVEIRDYGSQHGFEGGLAEENINTDDEVETEHETCLKGAQDLEGGTITAPKDELMMDSMDSMLLQPFKNKQVKDNKNSSTNNRNKCLKLTPDQRDTEEDIKSEISNKIKAGVLKLTKSPTKRSVSWKVFDLITTTNDTIVEDYLWCTICAKPLKCKLLKVNSLHRHKCYTQFVRLRELEIIAKNNTLEGEAMENMEKDVKDKIRSDCIKTTNPIWTRFSLISMTDGSHIKEMVCCRLCKAVLKYNGEGNEDILYQHKCLQAEENSKKGKYHTVSAENKFKGRVNIRKLEISLNISKGVYKLSLNPNSRSEVWKFFARIIETNGAIVEDFVCCPKCMLILAYDGCRTSNFKRHPCMKNSKLEEKKRGSPKKTLTTKVIEEENEYNKIKRRRTDEEPDATYSDDSNASSSFSGQLKVVNEAENPSYANDAIWLNFELISMDDGSTLEGVVGCRHCKSVLKYDGTTKSRLEEHACFPKASVITAVGNANDLECPQAVKDEIDVGYSYSICVKEEYNYNNSPICTEFDFRENSANETLPIIEKNRENQCVINDFGDTDSNESIEIKKELYECKYNKEKIDISL